MTGHFVTYMLILDSFIIYSQICHCIYGHSIREVSKSCKTRGLQRLANYVSFVGPTLGQLLASRWINR